MFVLTMKFSICIHFFCTTCTTAHTFGILFLNSLHNCILNGPNLNSALHDMSCMKGSTSQQSPTLRVRAVGCPNAGESWEQDAFRCSRKYLVILTVQELTERYGLMLGSAYTHSSHPLLFRLPF